jgi:anti-sigma factor RsiW
MIGNFDDQMARLAFGEVSDAERERLREEAERNPVVAARLREYEALRFELTRLREVPSDQLSKERLREALLARAIRPEPKRAWNWGYASLAGFAFCAAAAVVWSTRLLHTPEPAVILDAAKSASSSVALRAPRDLPSETPSTAANTAVPSTPALVASRTAAPTERSSGYRLASRRIKRAKREVVNSDYDPDVLIGAAKAAPKQYQAKVEPNRQPESVPSIVLIDQGKGSPGEAGKATEVGSPNDVLIGG